MGNWSSDNKIEAPLPERLDMTWLSYVDNKLYKGDWKLPTEKIQQLFDQGFYSKTGSKIETEPYTCITIGLAPKGMVVVWVSGIGRQVEVAHFQAHETTIDPKLITEEEKYMFEKDYAKDMLTYEGTISKYVREQIKLYGYPPAEIYDSYREKYLWKPKIILPEGCRINSLYMKMCNGEIEDPYDKPVEQKSRALPYVFEIYWYVGNGKNQHEFVSRIAFTKDEKFWENFFSNSGEDEIPVDFDQNEIRKLFKQNIDKNTPAEIVIKIDPVSGNERDWSVQISLEQSNTKKNINQICHDSGKYD